MMIDDAQAASRAYIALGSNLGDRQRFLQRALEALPCTKLAVLRASSVYESAPVGPVLDQPWFLNAVVEVRAELEPHDLLAHLLDIEQRLGRRRVFALRKGPRCIDLDLLLVGTRLIRDARLELPHPALCERAFVLRPLLELAPTLCDPRDGTPLATHWQRLGAELHAHGSLKVGACG